MPTPPPIPATSSVDDIFTDFPKDYVSFAGKFYEDIGKFFKSYDNARLVFSLTYVQPFFTSSSLGLFDRKDAGKVKKYFSSLKEYSNDIKDPRESDVDKAYSNLSSIVDKDITPMPINKRLEGVLSVVEADKYVPSMKFMIETLKKTRDDFHVRLDKANISNFPNLMPSPPMKDKLLYLIYVESIIKGHYKEKRLKKVKKEFIGYNKDNLKYLKKIRESYVDFLKLNKEVIDASNNLISVLEGTLAKVEKDKRVSDPNQNTKIRSLCNIYLQSTINQNGACLEMLKALQDLEEVHIEYIKEVMKLHRTLDSSDKVLEDFDVKFKFFIKSKSLTKEFIEVIDVLEKAHSKPLKVKGEDKNLIVANKKIDDIKKDLTNLYVEYKDLLVKIQEFEVKTKTFNSDIPPTTIFDSEKQLYEMRKKSVEHLEEVGKFIKQIKSFKGSKQEKAIENEEKGVKVFLDYMEKEQIPFFNTQLGIYEQYYSRVLPISDKKENSITAKVSSLFKEFQEFSKTCKKVNMDDLRRAITSVRKSSKKLSGESYFTLDKEGKKMAYGDAMKKQKEQAEASLDLDLRFGDLFLRENRSRSKGRRYSKLDKLTKVKKRKMVYKAESFDILKSKLGEKVLTDKIKVVRDRVTVGMSTYGYGSRAVRKELVTTLQKELIKPSLDFYHVAITLNEKSKVGMNLTVDSLADLKKYAQNINLFIARMFEAIYILEGREDVVLTSVKSAIKKTEAISPQAKGTPSVT